jgi:hypothetical protein
MEEGRLPKEVMKWRPPGRIKRGRPKLTWAEGIGGLMGEKGLTFILLMWRIGRAPNSIPIYSYIQQDATSHSLFISGNWNRSECAVDGVRHPQHTQTGSNSSTIAADSSNGVTNIRCCRYSCMRSR